MNQETCNDLKSVGKCSSFCLSFTTAAILGATALLVTFVVY